MRMTAVFLASAIFTLCHDAALHAASVNILAPDLKVVGADWRYYNLGDFSEGAYMGWLYANVKSVKGIIALPGAPTRNMLRVRSKESTMRTGAVRSFRVGGTSAPHDRTTGTGTAIGRRGSRCRSTGSRTALPSP